MNVFIRIALCCLMFTLVSGCAASQAGTASSRSVSVADVAGKTFDIVSIDGKDFIGSGIVPEISFTDTMQVAGRACNRFTGPGTLQNSVLVVKNMASTKMFCPDQRLNTLESTLASMFAAGTNMTLAGNTLTLRQGGHVLVYTLREAKK